RRPVVLWQREDAAHEDRDDDDGDHQIAARDLLTELEVRDAPREHNGDDRVADRVEIHEHEQPRGHSGEQSRGERATGPGAPDANASSGLGPLVFDVDLGEGTRREEKDRGAGESQEYPAPWRHHEVVTPERPATAATLPSRPGLPRAAPVSMPRTGRQSPAACWRRE